MERKGLCNTCVHDRECAFPKKFPVWQCEEYIDYKPRIRKLNKSRHNTIKK